MKSKSSARGIIKDIAIVVIGVLIIWIALQVVFGTQNPFYVVSSGSMIPELQVYDVLVVQGNDPFEELEIGDVIVFNRPTGSDRVIVHRVAAFIDEDPLTIRTKGDANPASIPGTDFPITEKEYIGQVAYVLPQVGYVTRILTPPINYIIIAIIVGIMIFKQVSKKKNEKELTFVEDEHIEQKEKEEKLDSFDKLDEIYKNHETDLSKKDPENKDTKFDEKSDFKKDKDN